MNLSTQPLPGMAEYVRDLRREAEFNCAMAKLDAEIAATRITLKTLFGGTRQQPGAKAQNRRPS